MKTVSEIAAILALLLCVSIPGSGFAEAPGQAASVATEQVAAVQVDVQADVPIQDELVQVPVSQSGPVIVDHQGVVSLPASNASCGCARCMQCVDRDGAGLIGGIGFKYGVGPCDHEFQCWQCPYNSPFNSYGPWRLRRIGADTPIARVSLTYR